MIKLIKLVYRETSWPWSDQMKQLKHMGQFIYNLSLTKKLFDKKFEVVKEELVLSMGEINVLLWISNNPEYNMARDIVKYNNISKAYVSKAVTSLEKRNLIRMEPDEEDRRMQRLFLEESAEEKVEQLNQVLEEFYLDMKKNITNEELGQFMEIAKRMGENVRISLGEEDLQ